MSPELECQRRVLGVPAAGILPLVLNCHIVIQSTDADLRQSSGMTPEQAMPRRVCC